MPDTDDESGQVVIIGGAGFIGSHLAHHHRSAGDDVVVADIADCHIPGVTAAEVDIRSPFQLPVSARPRVVYNLAAVHRTPGHAPHEYYETNVAGAINVTRWAADVGARTMVFTSSIAAYGPTEVVVDESSAPAPTSDYGRSKLLAEEIHRDWASAERRLKIIRPAVVFGKGERGNFTRMAAAMQTGRFVVPGRLDTLKACGYVKDLVRACDFLARDAGSEVVYNFAFPQLYSISDIVEALGCEGSYTRPKVLPLGIVTSGLRLASLAPLSKVADLKDRVQKLLTSTAVRPLALERAGFAWQFDLQLALADWRREAGNFV